jgi:serine/threonine-protein kinase RsbW
MTTVALTVPAKAEYLVLCRLVLTGLSRSFEIDPESLADLKLAVTEACANSVRHAYEDAEAPGTIRILYQARDGEVEVCIADEGRGFAVAQVPELGREAFSEDGMGLGIIRAVVDELEIDAGPGGSRIRFVKRLGVG